MGKGGGREQTGQEGYAGDHLLLAAHWCILSSPGNCTVGSAGEATFQRSTPLIRKCFSGWGKFISSSCWVKMQIRFSFCSGIGLDFTTLIPLRTKQMSIRRLEKCTGWIWCEEVPGNVYGLTELRGYFWEVVEQHLSWVLSPMWSLGILQTDCHHFVFSLGMKLDIPLPPLQLDSATG